MLHTNVYVLTFRALKLARPRVDTKAYYYCCPAKLDLESSENSTNNKFSSDYIDGIRKLKKKKSIILVTFSGYQNGEKNGRKISEKENRKKNFSLWADAPLPTEKIWEREKQKQIIYANEYRNTINDGDSQARRIYKEISEICFKWSSTTSFEP